MLSSATKPTDEPLTNLKPQASKSKLKEQQHLEFYLFDKSTKEQKMHSGFR